MTGSKEKIVVIGYGWVGQANALALTMMGHPVFYYDIVNPEKRYPNYEKAYEKIRPLNNALEQDSENTWYLVCVGDRVDEKGNQDISLIKEALGSVKSAKGRIILRSTVLPKHLQKLDFDFYVPEFLHEKHGVEECFHPYYLAIGARNNILKPSFLKKWQGQANKVFEGTPEEASYIKYLSNIWNATRIAFVNEFGNAVQQSSVNPDNILNFLFENRNYLRYGRSFRGHCLPKDISAFSASHNNALFKAVLAVNTTHKAKEEGLPEWFSGWHYQSDISFSRLFKLLGQKISSKFKKIFG